ncbi:MAG: YfhO family protein [Chloroflexi bacterium]|nr:YfhO family protein [Chloroflexota bacterium]
MGEVHSPPRPRLSPDLLAVLMLAALWLLFFWRLLTPIEADQASLKKGDFSGQFVAFAAYQYDRLTAGEVPLWNPYNNGGLPFLADTQSAVFYPPRLATIALSYLSGGWTYHALELEMAFHMLAYSLLLYALVRRMTLAQPGSIVGGLVAAIVGSYGGFMTGYPPLQLALLEAGVWLPLAALGILEATRTARLRWGWLALTGAALGLSWLAGHPQTSYFLTLLLVAYLGYRAYLQHYPWAVFVLGAALFGLIALGVAAVQLLPGLEYLPRTARVGFSYDAKGNGFPIRDVVQLLFPGVMSLFSPLYVGVVALALAVIALWRRVPGSLFWGLVALVGLGLSLGANSAVFPALYNLLPGMRFFRGQERAAYLVANSLALLAGLGASHLAAFDKLQDFKAARRIQQALAVLTVACGTFAAVLVIVWLSDNEAYGPFVNPVVFSAVIAAAALLLIPWLLANPHQPLRLALLVALVAFELFTVNLDSPATYDSIPPDEQLVMPPEHPPLLDIPLNDNDTPFRVDGYRGLHDNFGSLYRLMDMRGISPLWLDGPYRIIEPDLINPLAWELFAVRYVYTDWEQMPVASEVIASGEDRYGKVNLHRLTNPRPFAHLVYDYTIASSDELAYAMLQDPAFQPRRAVILNRDPGITRSGTAPETAQAIVTGFKPESFTVEVSTPADAILTLAHPDYPGWQAALDGQPAAIFRAYGALSAVVVPAGDHTVRFTYDPLTYRAGALLSLVTWGALGILVAVSFGKSWINRKPQGRVWDLPHRQ